MGPEKNNEDSRVVLGGILGWKSGTDNGGQNLRWCLGKDYKGERIALQRVCKLRERGVAGAREEQARGTSSRMSE